MAPALLQAAALALRAASTVCPTSPTCPQDDQCSYAANGFSFQVSCATDYYGGDLKLAHTSTIAACINACSTTTSCVAASFVSGNCYMKSALNAADKNDNVVGIAVTSSETPTAPAPGTSQQMCPASFTCPENNGCLYTDGSRSLTLSCGMDFYGGDLASQYAESLGACTRACATNTDCVAASFVGGKGAGTCYLKSTQNNGNINDNVDGVYVVSASASPSSSATLTTSTVSSSTSLVMVSSTTATISSTDILSSSTLLSSTVAPSSTALPSSSSALSTDSSSSIASPTTDATSTVLSASLSTISSVASTTVIPTPSVTASTESSTQVVSSSATSSSATTSLATLSSSTPASTSTVSSSSLPSPSSVVANGGFEGTDSTPWIIKVNNPALYTYNFMDTNSPHGGAQVASIESRVANNVNQAWFNQPITLQPNTKYNLSAWVMASVANPGCNVYFYIGSLDGNAVLKIMAVVQTGTLTTNWSQATGFYDSGATAGAVTFNVRTTCNSGSRLGRKYYVDDISLVSA